MHSLSKPWWQQVTALVSLSAGGVITGFSFVPRAAADIKSPSSIPIHLLALKQSNQQATADDGMLRSAIVNVANYYLRMAAGKTPAEVEAIIWQHDSVDGIDHGESCAAFASLTLELAAQVVGQQSWVTRIRRRSELSRSCRMRRRINAGTRSVTVISHRPATGYCSMATSR
jgi:hypothetical protein